MIWAARQLFAPVRYLKIKQGGGIFSSKATYDFVIPGALAAISTAMIHGFSLSIGFFAKEGLVDGVVSFLNLVIAFFIAALAAVSTFDRKGLDEKMKGDAALLPVRRADNVRTEVEVTHRQFVCYLFGYLSFVSICFLVGLHFTKLFAPKIRDLLAVASPMDTALKVAALLLFFFVLWQIVVTMFLGIYFLCDRLQFMDKKEL